MALSMHQLKEIWGIKKYFLKKIEELQAFFKNKLNLFVIKPSFQKKI
jgi:hypothetical protein